MGGKPCAALFALWLGAAVAVQTAVADQVRYFAKGPEAFDARITLLRQARSTIDIAMFIWRPDDAGLGIAALLREATRRGVRVRVIVDAVANELPPSVIAALNGSSLFEARVYHVPSVHEPSRLNRRMHDKFVITDNRRLMIGGRNFAVDYFASSMPRPYLDLDLLADGQVAADATRHFERLWASSQVDRPEWHLPSTPARQRRLGGRTTGETQPGTRQGHRMIDTGLVHLPIAGRESLPAPDATVAAKAMTFIHDPIPKRPGNSTCWRSLVQQLQAARHEVWLVTPWLVTTPESSAILQGCLQRGVRVHIVSNSLNACRDPLVFAAHADSCRRLASDGCTIHLMPGPASLHSKALIVDGAVAVVGSQNYDPRSELWNTESMVVIRDRQAARALRETIDQQAAGSYVLDPRSPNMLGTARPSAALRWRHFSLSLLRAFDPLLRPVL